MRQPRPQLSAGKGEWRMAQLEILRFDHNGPDDLGVVYEFKAPEVLLVPQGLHNAWLSREDVPSA